MNINVNVTNKMQPFLHCKCHGHYISKLLVIYYLLSLLSRPFLFIAGKWTFKILTIPISNNFKLFMKNLLKSQIFDLFSAWFSTLILRLWPNTSEILFTCFMTSKYLIYCVNFLQFHSQPVPWILRKQDNLTEVEIITLFHLHRLSYEQKHRH